MNLFSKQIDAALDLLETGQNRKIHDPAAIYLQRLDRESPFAIALLNFELEPWLGLVHLAPRARGRSFDYQKVKFTMIENAVIESPLGTEVVELCSLLALPSVLRESFVQISSELTSLHGKNASDEQLYRVIEAWSEAFLQDAEPTDGEVLGLWGELMVILNSPEPDAMVKAWHGEKYATYDFVFADGSVFEVKTAGHGIRKHSFSSNQIHLGMPTSFKLISIVALPSDSGLSVGELKEEILGKLESVDSQISFLRKLSRVFPPQSKKMNLAWILEQGKGSIRYYSTEDLSVPSFEYPISDVSWTQVFDVEKSDL